MINKKIINKIIFILLINIIFLAIPNNVQASFFSKIITDAKEFTSHGTQDNVSGTNIKEMFADLFGVFITAGLIVAVIIASILGIKFLLASPEGKAEIKETMTPYVIGCIVIFGAYAIWRVVLSILSPLG